ncbi:hypothetical protein TREMEDRAFT_61582 [Tremella mesenterica DSM 1558]|uniref:uncharacterized protein n=1 Tax=Tremella mesenterica (strain ATCC 24925 / CBS 8224 / DSM 1558 / NBRC 9311 / NRRL Y-6157 / RJB 2259-6 / UBC 559-6) TaxID=578456 RepID=UPI0003F48DB4|nr:uncharacterized protein TREMEDRAFT_61582 [Tremella mesenterica DSM 1558]EIW69813.1 hypothetical protein TREMEDRAFT_61582 [Tremella mesenterica DSM 1558]
MGGKDIEELWGPNGGKWDGGEEEEEDDELESGMTILDGHSHGWTLLQRVYLFNGSFYVVTDKRQDWPLLEHMISTGLPANEEPGNAQARFPKGDEIIFVSPYEAAQLWGNRVYRMSGMTWLWNDGQFMDHYYHFAAELLMGTWRTYATYDPDITPTGQTTLVPPKRIWFLHQHSEEWRDGPKFNPLLLSALFPSTSFLYPEDFRDYKTNTASGPPSLHRAFLLDRILLVDRSAAFYGHWTEKTSRTVASAYHVGPTSPYWWEPIRRTVLRFSGLSEDILNRNLEGYGSIDSSTTDHPLINVPEGVVKQVGDYKPVITYISRQSSRRHLKHESHLELVENLEKKAKENDWELYIVEAEKMTKEEQFALAGKTTIMLGVHGNGLTHLIWMPSTPRSAVIEMFYRGGFARDYSWTAESLGIKHYGVRHDEYYTEPDIPEVLYPEGFHGTEITVDGKFVVELIENRLAGRI